MTCNKSCSSFGNGLRESFYDKELFINVSDDEDIILITIIVQEIGMRICFIKDGTYACEST